MTLKMQTVKMIFIALFSRVLFVPIIKRDKSMGKKITKNENVAVLKFKKKERESQVVCIKLYHTFDKGFGWIEFNSLLLN